MFSTYTVYSLSFHADPVDKFALESSMKYIKKHTCVKFIEVEPTYKFYTHYVHFISTTEERYCDYLHVYYVQEIMCMSYISAWKSCLVCSYWDWVYSVQDCLLLSEQCMTFMIISRILHVQTCDLFNFYAYACTCNYNSW